MTYQPAQPAQPHEDVSRGTVVALLAIPAGIIVFVLVWSIGFIASAVTLGVAYLARFLYLLGSGGVMSRAGAIRVSIITISTVILSIVGGVVSDVAIRISLVSSLSPIEALSDRRFSTAFESYLSESNHLLSILIALAFGALGCFSLLRTTLRTTAAPVVNPATGLPWSQTPITPAQPQQLWPQNPTIPPTEENPPR